MSQPIVEPARFSGGMRWPAYVSQMTRNRALIERLYDEIEIAPGWRARYAGAVERAGSALAVSALTEDWCGDAIMVLPLLARLCETVDGMTLRLFVRPEEPELAAAYARDGLEVLPILSFFDAGWREIARWVEKPAAAGPPKGRYLADFPELPQLRAAGTPEAFARLSEIFGGLLELMAGWYRDGLWEATLEEWLGALEGSTGGSVAAVGE